MRQTIESTGTNLEDVVSKGIKELGVTRDEVTYEILSQSEAETKVRLSIKEPRQYLAVLANYFLNYMGFKSNVSIVKDEHGYIVNIRTRHAEPILIGKNGETLWALQHLISRRARRFYSNIKVLVDVNGYRAKRNNFLRKKAEVIARIVLQTGREMAFDPLTPREERLVMNKINEIKGVKVYTIGKGPNRNLVIAPSSESQKQNNEESLKL